MKVLHVVYSLPPDPPGGTEIYVDGLARDLAALGIDVALAAPAGESRSYDIDGLPAYRYAANPSPDLDAIYGRGDMLAGESFGALLDRVAPDVVHLHAYSPACALTVVDAITRRGLPLVFTYHTPDVSCPRGTLLRRGVEPCDGELAAERCSTCVLDGHGIGEPLATLLAHVPGFVGAGLARSGLAGRGVTALRLRGLLERRRAALREFLQAPARIISLTPWVRGVLEANGVSSERVVDSAHGVAPSRNARPAASRPTSDVRIAHLGRLHPVKGTALLLEAVRRVESSRLRLDVFGVIQDRSAEREADRLTSLADGDARVRFLPAVPHENVVATLSTYDAVAVPSQWLETGPLVVLEANQAGVPVIGSAWGGIAERVRHDVDGLLVDPPAAVDAWAAVLRRCVDEPGLLARLGARLPPARARMAVARDMARVYAQLTPAAVAPAAGIADGV